MDAQAEFERAGFVHVRGALDGPALHRLRRAHRRVCEQSQANPDGSVHLLGFLPRDERFLEPLDHPAVFPLVWGTLGWNIHLYHCHLDLHPRVSGRQAPWRWHQDGGRQNVELETDPRPQMSVKVAWFLSDLSRPGRGNLLVIPQSHRRNTLQRVGDGRPLGAVEICAGAGDALVFDRRLWHARSDNIAGPTRRAIFLAYTYRWVRERDEMVFDPAVLAALDPVRRQLLGQPGAAVGRWIPTDDDVPLRTWLRLRGDPDGGGLSRVG